MKKLAALALPALAIVATACGGAKSTNAPIANAATEGGAVQPIAPPAVNIESAEDAHRLLPASAIAFFGIDFAKISRAAVLAKYQEKFVDQMPGELVQLKAECGLDVMKDFDWLVGGMASDSEQAVLMLKGNFTQKQIEDCIDKMNATKGSGATIADEGDLRVYTVDGDRIYASWPTDSLVIIGVDDSRAMVEEVVGRVGATAVESSVAADLAHVDTSASFWLSARIMPSMQSGLPVQDMTAMRMTAETGATLDLIVAAEFSSSTKAADTYNQVTMFVQMGRAHPQAKPFVAIIDKTKIAHTDRVVSGSVFLTEADLDTIETQMKMIGAVP